MNILLQGIVGSRAYGLDHTESDTDRMAIYAAPTRQLLGLGPPPEAITTTKPDVATFELGKYVRMALNGNPTVLELMWLPSGLYEKRSPIGNELIALRQVFLSAGKVQAAYLGFADRQMTRLGAVKSSDVVGRERRQKLAKSGRHLARLLHQGLNLYQHGRLTVRLDPDVAERCRAVGGQVAGGDLAVARALVAEYVKKFDEATTPLPAYPDVRRADLWLRDARVRLLAAGGVDVHKQG